LIGFDVDGRADRTTGEDITEVVRRELKKTSASTSIN
jgi:hypothetical protein